jgi:glycosyltransferase involved in cell wall biosynthesis
MQEKIGIGVPVYNGEGTLERAILSLLNQTYSNFKILISDNASEDRTSIICQRLCKLDQRIVYVRQDTNIGIGKNFEYVYRNLDEEYFMWASADDRWSRNFLEYNLENLQNNTRIIASISKSEYENPLVKDLGDHSIFSNSLIIKRFSYLMNPGINIRLHSLMRRKEIDKLRMDAYTFIGADWALVYDLLAYGNFYRDDREVGFTKAAHGLSSDINLTIKLSRNKFISYLLPLHELTLHILKNNGIIYLPLLLKHNLIYILYSMPIVHKYLKFIKYKINYVLNKN